MKKRTVALLLCAVLGCVGGHMFYAGRNKEGWGYVIHFGVYFAFRFFDFIADSYASAWFSFAVVTGIILFMRVVFSFFSILSGNFADSTGGKIAAW